MITPLACTGEVASADAGRRHIPEITEQGQIMEFGPGKWSETLIDPAENGENNMTQSFADYGEGTASEVMAIAQYWVTGFTVVIVTTGMARDTRNVKDLTPGTGVVVRLDSHTYGVLTAGHVLRRGDNTKDNAEVAVLSPSRDRQQGDDTKAIELSPRPCTVAGFDNETKEGPDIAIIPLDSREMSVLDGWGVNAYNLSKERWSDEDKVKLGEMNPWVFSIINGMRCEASQIVHGHTDGSRGSLAILATNTRVETVRERDGYDYLELPSATTEYSYSTNWKEALPGTAAEEIEQLHSEGVTRDVWGGTSGAGVWNMAVGTNREGLPNGHVFGALAGICFYADPDNGCVIAHGDKSIAKIGIRHIEKEALRYHGLA